MTEPPVPLNNDRLNRLRERKREKEGKKAPEPVRMTSFNSYDKEKENYLQRSGNKGKFNARWISGFLTLIFGVLTAGYAFLPQFRFSEIGISGMEKISVDELFYFAGVKGKPVFMADPTEIRSTIISHYQDVYDAEVSIDFPAVLNVQLEERVPVVEWDFGGSRFWIDKDGMVLNESSSREGTIHVYADSYPGAVEQADRDVPLYFSRDVLRTIMTMAAHVPEGKPLYYTYKNGFGWDTDDGWRIFFGKNDSDMDEKLRMEKGLTAYFHENEIQPIFVSLEYKDAPYYRFVEN